ncbi:hypothetical protein C8R47DRAFT_1268230 [Mycena vitilis]|nr:hypothetical protein C8R47DRAFT_1268230 [Mycena vitilis]
MSICSNCGHNDAECLSLRSPDAPADLHDVSLSSPPQLRAQLDKVNSVILRQKKCLDEHKSTVLRQQKYLEALERQQRELRIKLAQIIYPVIPLPTEIISRIFLACLPNHGRMRPARNAPPLVLVQVCRHWRNIVLSSSELWASVDLSFPLNRRGWPLPLLETWFSRANRRPLSVTIRSYQDVPRPLLSLLSSIAGRLHTLELKLSQKDFQSLKRDNIAFPHLKRLAVFSNEACTPDLFPLSAFGNAPTLEDLKFQSEPPGSLWDLYPSLLYLRAAVNDQFPTFLCDQHLPFPLPQLQSLILLGTDIDSLTVPGLRRLELDVRLDPYDITPVFPSLLAFLARSSCVLDHLALKLGDDDSANDFATCLKAVPAVSSLDVEVNDDADEVIQLLTLDPPLVTQLRILAITASPEYFDYIAFVKLLQLRSNDTGPFARLESVRLGFHDKNLGWRFPASVKVEFNKLITKGLKLTVTLGGYPVLPEGDDDLCADF